ncbi:unnamed protein product [Prorocentrum cordatum]|uniref:Biogenesis of lysosome-related organelles complex 1 subunit 7 n=1 Tax=Prorocentrum cordatum TaxID=2364126 RepID=A0ABN9SJL1_9DINO|nr:unnamed protein product [Polarella glacialis]
MPESHPIGTPKDGKAQKQQRLRSPLHEMDDDLPVATMAQSSDSGAVVPRRLVYAGVDVELPPQNIENPEAAVTMGAMNQLFRDYMAPMINITQALGKDLEDLKSTVESGMEEIEIRRTNLDNDIEYLRGELQ